MSERSKPDRAGGDAGGDAPSLDTVARRIEELSTAVAEETERLLEHSERVTDRDLATILDAARRSSELARELVALARRERDSAAEALLGLTSGRRWSSETPPFSEPARSYRRVRSDGESAQRVVLLVEDEPLLLKTMRRMLEQYGHRVVAASKGSEALAFAANEPDLALLVTDLALPGMQGAELVRRLRASRPELRVLYTSGWDPASSGVTLADDGSEAFLSKPFTAVELDARLCELLGTPPLTLALHR